jgi:hypothetical protein
MIAKVSKTLTRQMHASEAANEPKYHDNDQEQADNASEPRASVAAVSIVPSAAKKKNQYDDDQQRAHDLVSGQILIAPAEPMASITS